jgi:hypothetical protein
MKPRLEVYGMVTCTLGTVCSYSIHETDDLSSALQLTRCITVLVGTAKDFPEHAIVPPLKLIDFGLATQTDSAVQDNLSAITKVMMKLITNDAVTVQSELRLYNGVMTMAAEILPGAGNHYPTLDPDLRDLVARCLATDAADRPDLATMLQVTQDAVTNKDAASFSPNDFLETDEEIQRVLQIILYDAD